MALLSRLGVDIRKLLADYHVIFLMLLALMLPFRAFGPASGFNPMPTLIILWALIWLADTSFHRRWSRLKLSYDALLPAFFVLISIFSLLYSANPVEGWSKIQVRLSILFIPFLMLNRIISRGAGKAIVRTFILSNATASLFLILRALIRYSDSGWHAFFYSELSYFLHPSYYALYLLICLIFIILLRDSLAWPSGLRFAFSLFFLLMIFLSSSRAGILAAIIVVAFSLYRSPLIRRISHKYLMIAVLLILGVLALFLNYRTSSAALGTTAAMRQSGNPKAVMETVEATTSPARVMIWKSSVELLKDHWLIGYGIGDVQSELTASYQQQGYAAAAGKRLNAHNQYLQSLLEAGLPSFITLLLLFMPWRRLGLWRKSGVGIAILMTFALHLLFESMLNAQAGVIMLAWALAFIPHLVNNESSVFLNSALSPA